MPLRRSFQSGTAARRNYVARCIRPAYARERVPMTSNRIVTVMPVPGFEPGICRHVVPAGFQREAVHKIRRGHSGLAAEPVIGPAQAGPGGVAPELRPL